MVAGRSPLNGLRPYKDGFLTRRATFQKYYVQDELRCFVAEVTGETPVAMAPGIFAVFRDKDEEQELLLSRRSSLRALPPTMRPPAAPAAGYSPARYRGPRAPSA